MLRALILPLHMAICCAFPCALSVWYLYSNEFYLVIIVEALERLKVYQIVDIDIRFLMKI